MPGWVDIGLYRSGHCFLERLSSCAVCCGRAYDDQSGNWWLASHPILGSLLTRASCSGVLAALLAGTKALTGHMNQMKGVCFARLPPMLARVLQTLLCTNCGSGSHAFLRAVPEHSRAQHKVGAMVFLALLDSGARCIGCCCDPRPDCCTASSRHVFTSLAWWQAVVLAAQRSWCRKNLRLPAGCTTALTETLCAFQAVLMETLCTCRAIKLDQTCHRRSKAAVSGSATGPLA